MNITLDPNHPSEIIRFASRCCMRVYAKHIKNELPKESKEIYDYVAKLDAAERNQISDRLKKIANDRARRVRAIIMHLLSLDETGTVTAKDIRAIISCTKMKGDASFVTHYVEELLRERVIGVHNGYLTLVNK